MKFYHVSGFENFPKILKEGIKSNDLNEIFVFDDEIDLKHEIPYAAKNQLGYKDYVLFEIDGKGIIGNIVSDDVGELTAKHQRIIYQSVIEPKCIKFKGMFKVKD
jgi:hypothetical protein